MVYAIWVERIEADVRTAQQVALMASVMGGKPEWPSLDERLAEFDAELVAVPVRVDLAELELREALGLRRPGA